MTTENSLKSPAIRPARPLVPTEDNRIGGYPCVILHPKGWRLMSIPDEVRKCVAYLYRKTDKNLEPVGTVFFVGYEIEHIENGKLVYLPYWLYAVTSRHVIETIREKGVDQMAHFALNSRNGETVWQQIPLSRWKFPSGSRSDVAVVDIEFNLTEYDHLCFPQRGFLTHDVLDEWGIGPGDKLYFSGLFTKRPGAPGNIPIIRVGNIAALPSGIIKTKWSDIDAYLVEARSIGGLSGSPVFYSPSGYGKIQSRDYEPPNVALSLYLLGYIQGHYDENDAGDRFNMGIALAVPASEVLLALNHPILKDSRDTEFAAGLEDYRHRIMPIDD